MVEIFKPTCVLLGIALTAIVGLTMPDAQPAKAQAVSHSTSFVVFPADCNANPPMLFGGKLLSEMDRCAGIAARRFLYGSTTGAKDAVTVAINNVTFRNAGEVKDLIVVMATVTKAGSKSITMHVTATRERAQDHDVLADGEFVFVAFDLATKKAIEHGVPMPTKEK